MPTTDAPTHQHRCQHRTVIGRCTAPATHRFLVNGVPATYAGCTCLAHGEQVCAEYAVVSATIGAWTLEALDDLEASVPDSPHPGIFYTPATVFDPALGSGGLLAAIGNPPLAAQPAPTPWVQP